jgi:nicotinate phosphoribosyltransferase
MVYKLVAHRDDAGAWVPVAKTSASKESKGGRKDAVRGIDASGIARQEIVVIGEGPAATDDPADETGDAAEITGERQLLVPLVTDGEIDERYLGIAGTRLAREHHASAMAELPVQAFRLGRGEPVIPTVYR